MISNFLNGGNVRDAKLSEPFYIANAAASTFSLLRFIGEGHIREFQVDLLNNEDLLLNELRRLVNLF